MADRATQMRIGCSGWSYADWRGVVYPADLPQRRWFEHYQQRFDTVELNSTFYRLPTAQAVEGWAAAAHPDFLFALKLGAFGSHRKKLSDATTWLPNHLERVRLLGEHLGPTLVQLPPRWKRNVARLDEFLDATPHDLRWAVELRDPSWVHDDVFEVLRRHGAALCIHDLLPAHPLELTTDWTYVRFHGPNAIEHPYHGSYERHRLHAFAGWLEMVRDEGHDAFVYFNNDWHGAAVHDAVVLREMLDVRPACVTP